MMWELISANRKKSMWLFIGMAILLVTLGFFVGHVWMGDQGGLIGIGLAVFLWGLMTLVSITNGDRILLSVAGAKEVTPEIHPQLFNVVEEMKIAAQLPAMPKVYIVDSPSPNAFAIGLKPEKAAVAVTAGLLTRLNRDELQGVMAHEIAHIVNRDSQLMTVAGIMLGSIVLISQVFLRSMWFMPGGSSKRYRKNDSGGGSPQLQLIMVVVAIALAILAPIFSRLLYFALSRKREYLADATAAQLTRYPEGLASALEKLQANDIPLESANKVTAPMYIVNPLQRKGHKLSNLGSTHPPLQERIDILRAMHQGADYYTYQKAFNEVRGKTNLVIPKSVRKKDAHVAIREPHPEAAPVKDKKATVREVGDLMRAVNGYAFLVCACGLKMKIPPDMEKPHVDCPRCGRENEVPAAELAVVAEVVGAAASAGQSDADDDGGVATATAGGGREQHYQRRTPGWESFACSCGHHMQLSPAFQASTMTCPQCQRITFIEPLK